MPGLLNITTPITPKNYEFTNKSAPQPQTDQVFNLSDTSKIQKPTERTEEFANRDNKDGSNLSISVAVSKNPSSAMSVLRSLVGTQAFSALAAEADAVLISKVTEFANEVMLAPGNLAADMAAQEKQATIYSDPIWTELKNLLINGSDEIGQAVLQFTKAASDASARDDVLNSISANLRYLADTAAPTRALAEQLMNMANSLTKENFAAAKPVILNLLDQLSGTLLINNDTKNLISLVVYNMSRYNSSNTALGESFNAILDMTSSPEQAEQLRTMFIQYIENADLPSDIKIESLNVLLQGSTPAASALSMLSEKVGAAMNNYDISLQALEILLRGISSENGTEALRDLFTAAAPPSMYGALNNIIKSYDSTGNIAALVDRMSIMINSIDDPIKKKMLADKANDILSRMSVNTAEISSITTDSLLRQQSLTILSNALGIKLNSSLKSISSKNLSMKLSRMDTTRGAASIRAIFEELMPDDTGEELNQILRSFNSTEDLNKLIDCLSIAINSVEDIDKKIIIAQSVNSMLENLTKSEGISYTPPTSMENLMDFLSKNINDPSLKSLSEMSKNDIMQGLLTAPGVFTPLLHYLVPIDDNGVKAFGELWADPDAENRNGAKESKHMFLCFEIENIGYFELNIQTQDNKLYTELLCPPGTSGIFGSLKGRISQIASANGYNAESVHIGTALSRRDLTQVFPKIQDKRGGLNVKI